VKQIEDDLYCHCGKDCYQCHIIWLGRCRWHSTWSCSGSVFQRLWSSWCYSESARVPYYDIVDQIFAVCWDTTSSNTCVFSGAIVLLCTKSWTLPSCGFSAGGTCWQNTSLTSLGHSLERRPRPPEGAVCQTSEGLANNQEWDWQNRRAGVTRKSSKSDHPCTTCQWSSAFGKRPWPWSIRSFVSYLLGVDAPGFQFHQPGPCHGARYCNCF
jgi:hypothetical protein